MVDKIRENRLRRMVERQGYALHKSRRRDPRAIDYGQYAIAKPGAAAARGFGLTLDQVEAWVMRER